MSETVEDTELERLGLYYPFIHFRDTDWLLQSALLLPRIARIVPPGFTPDDSSDVLQLIDELDFVIDLDPTEDAQSLAAEFIDALKEFREPLLQRYLVTNAPLFGDGYHRPRPRPDSYLDSSDPFDSPQPPLLRSHDEPRDLAAVHVGEMDQRAIEALCSLNLASRNVSLHRFRPFSSFVAGHGRLYRTDSWIAMRDEIAWVYMCALATHIARRNRLLPVTDDDTTHAFSHDWTVHDLFHCITEDSGAVKSGHRTRRTFDVRTAVGMLAIEVALPTTSKLSASEVIDIRRRHGRHLSSFQKELSRLSRGWAESMGDISKETVLRAYMEDVVKSEFSDPAERLRQALREERFGLVSMTMNYKFEIPVASAALGAALGADPIVTGSAAAAAGLLAIRRTAKKSTSQLLAPSAASYLVQINRRGGRDSGANGTIRGVLTKLRRIAGLHR